MSLALALVLVSASVDPAHAIDAIDGAASDEAEESELVVAQAEPSATAASPETAPQETAEPEPTAAEETDEGVVDEGTTGSTVAPPTGVEVFRVKGRGVDAIETDVPASVAKFDAADIEALGAQNVADLAKVTPNVEIRTAGATTPTFFIRGIGLADFNANAAGAVAIYQDGVAINAPASQLGLLYDVGGVTLDRGPQGTGSARNGSAGAIRIDSRKPTGQLGGQLRTGYGNYNATDMEGAIELPIMEEELSTRLSFRWTARDPFYRNGCGAKPDLESVRLLGAVFSPNPTNPALSRWIRDSDPNTPDGFLDYNRVPMCGENIGGNNRLEVFASNAPSAQRLALLSELPGGLPTKFGDRNRWATRGLVRWQPEDQDMDWLLKGYLSRLDEDSNLGQVVGTGGGVGGGRVYGGRTGLGYNEPDIQEMFARFRPAWTVNGVTDVQGLTDYTGSRVARNLDIRPRRGDFDRIGKTTLDTYGGSIVGDIQIAGLNFRTVSAYDAYDRFRDIDQDFTPNVVFEGETDDDAWQYFQELSLGGESEDEPFRWNFGGWYLMEQLHSDQTNFTSTFDNNRIYDQDTWSMGAWTGFSWDFLDDFTLESGIRYNWERKRMDHGFSQLVPPPPDIQTETWEAPTGNIVLRYRFTDELTVFWKYSHGWKPGHFNASASLSRPVTVAKPEQIDAWEMGIRGAVLDGRYSMSTSGFYYKYKDYQVFTVDDDRGSVPQIKVINADDAQVYGVEVEFRMEPFDGYIPPEVDGLVVTGRFGWLESQFLDFAVPSFVDIPGEPGLQAVNDYSGNRLINSPEFSFSASVEWTFDLGRYGSMIPLYDFTWSDTVYFDPGEGQGVINPVSGQKPLPKFAIGQKPTGLHNVRLGYRTPGGTIEVAGWIRNLTDETTRTQGFDAAAFANLTINYVGEPRTYGVDLSLAW